MKETIEAGIEPSVLERAKRVSELFYSNKELSNKVQQLRKNYEDLIIYSKLYLAICGETKFDEVADVPENLKTRLSEFESKLEKLVIEAENKKS